MYARLKDNLQRHVRLTESESDHICAKLIVKQLRRKELFYSEGQVCRSVAFVNSGCLRYFYVKEGEERTGQFFFENAWYTDYESFLTGQPSKQNIQALEPTELLLLSKKDLYELYDAIPAFERFGRIMAENAYLGSRKNNMALLTLNPEERYLNLIAERPKVIERIPLKYIASYLGVKPESLSRIRKRLFDSRRNS
ncbi:MAG: Crp/Fnr family transcriptional regulator [Cytophagales bacterium]|nr:Crp/Fnr family transcriptional regulator [Cytophagales bacterium]